jgi:nicotinamidase/pyrazinamidase
MMNTVLVDVDVQRDFCESDGALQVPGSPNDVFRSLIRRATTQAIPVLGSVDSHAYDAWEFASNDNTGPRGEAPGFPDHCVKGTPGWLKVDGTLTDTFRFVPMTLPESPAAMSNDLAAELMSGATQALYFEKEVYSLFANPLAATVVEAVNAALEGPRFAVFGVATDYCVKAAVLGLLERGYQVVLLDDAIAGITEDGVSAALREMSEAGVEIISCAQL